MCAARVLVVVVLLSGCGDDSGDASRVDAAPAGEVAFPVDYETSYVEVRGCRQGTQHGPDIRVFASASAAGPYQDRSGAFPEGAILVKEERFGAGDCTGPITLWTAMVKRADGSSAARAALRMSLVSRGVGRGG